MREKMILENLGLIYTAIKNLHYQYIDKDDYDEIFGAGLIGLIHGVDTYDGQRRLGYYLYICIANQIKRAFQIRTLKRNCNGKKDISLNLLLFEDTMQLESLLSNDEDIEQKVIDKDFTQILKQLEDKLNLKVLYQYYGFGYKQKNMNELAKEYNVSHQAIQQKVSKLKQVLKQELIKNYKEYIEQYMED